MSRTLLETHKFTRLIVILDYDLYGLGYVSIALPHLSSPNMQAGKLMQFYK